MKYIPLLILLSACSRQDKALKAEIERIKHERDSLQTAVKAIDDSLKVAKQRLQAAHQETEAAKSAADKTIKVYEKIRFVPYHTDSARLAAISELYPSAFRNR